MAKTPTSFFATITSLAGLLTKRDSPPCPSFQLKTVAGFWNEVVITGNPPSNRRRAYQAHRKPADKQRIGIQTGLILDFTYRVSGYDAASLDTRSYSARVDKSDAFQSANRDRSRLIYLDAITVTLLTL
ncbi:hypothetical protein CROQUDRAFT_90866 [Cronartium quercuum f. sp. fusiforme G11]|uniref:Uncharacterized protein n=1 Tax=Cronartium quercuum f. sp. fusiforme G11 TaxID=708437 RepID=A0A9P6NPM9_9BASI|nr:hypothetical protein CROQUDRAFT_90866 [Cronartium quercuum f. sp. fusiforme G11]